MRILIALIPCLAGCFVYRDIGSPPPDHQADARAATDAALAGGPITFRLQYDLEAGFNSCSDQLYVQTIGQTGGEAFVQVIDTQNRPVAVTADCTTCFCPNAAPIEGCASGPPTVAELTYHDHVDWRWSGSTFPLGACTVDNRDCQGSAVIAPGAYLARFCYSDSADGVGPNHAIGQQTCSDVPFQVPTDGNPVLDDVICAAP